MAVFGLLVNVWHATGYTPYGTRGFLDGAYDYFGYARLLAVPVALFAFLYQRGRPTKTLAWVALMLGLPFLGTVVYLFFGLNLTQDLRFRTKRKRDRAALKRYESTICDTSGGDLLQHLVERRPPSALARHEKAAPRGSGWRVSA